MLKKISVCVALMLVAVVSFAIAEPVKITVWAPALDKCDPKVEAGILACQIEEFNKSHTDVQAVLETGPIDKWTDFVKSGALSGKLPDVMYIDGPTLAFFAWSNYLLPLDSFISAELKADFLGSIIKQGTYQGNLYALGQFDSGLGIWGNKDYLQKAGVRIPTSVEDAWTKAEFEEVLAKLQKVEGVKYAMDMKMNYGQGEWFTYGFAPILQSMGGDLINRADYQSAAGVLNGPKAVDALTMFQKWITQGYVAATPAGDTDFDEGKTGLSWVGHWMYSRYKQALGDKLILLPLPKFGDKAATGTGSWAWAVGASTKAPEAAWAYLAFLMQPEEIIKMTNVAGAVPARKSALALSDLYKAGGDCALYPAQLDQVGVERPVTPAYPVITAAFAEAVNNIAKGADVKTELDEAVRKIDQDIQDNQGYPSK